MECHGCTRARACVAQVMRWRPRIPTRCRRRLWGAHGCAATVELPERGRALRPDELSTTATLPVREAPQNHQEPMVALHRRKLRPRTCLAENRGVCRPLRLVETKHRRHQTAAVNFVGTCQERGSATRDGNYVLEPAFTKSRGPTGTHADFAATKVQTRSVASLSSRRSPTGDRLQFIGHAPA